MAVRKALFFAFVLQQTEPLHCLSLRSATRGLVQKVSLGNSSKPRVHGYIPDGLTPDEYARLKQKEAERESKMNYGASGPRFASSTQAPDGDWMVMPSLWTQGIPSNFGRPASQQSMIQQQRRRARSTLLAAFFLALTAIHTVAWTVATTIARQDTVKILLLTRKSCSLWVAGNTIFAMMSSQFVAQRIFETMNRKHLWSKRRTMAVGCSVALLWNLVWNAFVFRPF